MNRSVISWIVYDVANTVFNLGVVGLFLPIWISQSSDATDADFGFPIAISMGIVLIASPFLGALTDQLKGRVRTFTLLNIIAVSATFLIGIGESLQLGIAFFSLAFICVYLAELLYNAMLSEASTSRNRGRVGGIAAGVGNVGSLVIIIFALQHDGISNFVFQVVSVIFLFSALPIFLFFDEQRGNPIHSNRLVLNSAWYQIKRTWVYFKQYPKVPRFFMARYFYMIAVTTSSTFAVLYGIKTMKFTETEIELVFLIGILAAIPGTVMWGFMVDILGSSSTLKWNLLGWSLILAFSASVPLMDLENQLWWPWTNLYVWYALSSMTGLCYGGLWVADKPLLIEISPSNLGQMFGIYGMVSRAAFLTGSLLWPLVAVNMGLGQPAAVISLMCCCLAGLILLIKFKPSLNPMAVS